MNEKTGGNNLSPISQSPMGSAMCIQSYLMSPPIFFIEALEPTKVYTIDYEAYCRRWPQKTPDIFELNRMRILGKRILKQAFQRVESFVLLSPEERYLKYLKDYPNVIDRAPDKYIAHVLGITPVSLSRIRKSYRYE